MTYNWLYPLIDRILLRENRSLKSDLEVVRADLKRENQEREREARDTDAQSLSTRR